MDDRAQKRLDYDNIGTHDEQIGLISHLKNIAWSCWYVIEDLWALIAPTVMMILRLMWKITKPILNHLWLYVQKLANTYPGPFRSGMLHLFILICIIGAIPFAQDPPKMTPPRTITLELLPIKEKTNVKPVEGKKPQANKPAAAPKSPVKKIATRPTPPPKPFKPKKLAEKPKPPKAKPKAPEKPKPAPKVAAKKPPTKPKVKEVKKSFTQMAAELDKLAKPEKTKQVSSNYDAAKPLSLSQIDAIRNQLVACWRILPGAREAAKIAVSVRFKLNKSGSVAGSVNVTDKSRYNSDPVFKAAADNAVRAVLRCSPLQNLPQDRYDSWKEMEFNFDPRDMY